MMQRFTEHEDVREVRGGFYLGVILALAAIALAVVYGGGQ